MNDYEEEIRPNTAEHWEKPNLRTEDDQDTYHDEESYYYPSKIKSGNEEPYKPWSWIK